MRIKNVVKVMNFHSLLRVEKAKKQAEKYTFMQNEMSRLLSIILNNKNFILDKKVLKPNPSGKVLNIYYGSDFGFCGNLNYLINSEILKDKETDKIIFGKKLRKNIDNVIFSFEREQILEKMTEIEEFLCESIKKSVYKQINLVYLEYKSLTEMSLTRRILFPTVIENVEETKDDFSCEIDIEEILFNIFVSYLGYQIKIADINCRASENIIRQNVTSESIKKIDEMEKQNLLLERKEKKQKSFKKVIESYSKMKNY